MKFTILFAFVLLGKAADGIRFSITPSTFVPGVTSSVTMRCDVAESGQEMTQLLLIQLEMENRGSYVPVVTLTPGGGVHIMDVGKDHNVQVDDVDHQFQDIASSYLSVTFPFPEVQLSANFTCVVSGLSSSGLLTRYARDASLNVGAVDELPRFMTAHVVELRFLVEKIRSERNALMLEAAALREMERNVTTDLASVESEYANVLTEMAALQSRAGQLVSLLSKPVSDLDRLSSVRPEMKVAFHAALSELGAKTVALHVPLLFDHVITNQGQGYDPSRGVFRAPVAGTYVLTMSVEAGPGNKNSEVSILNGKDIVQTMHLSDDLYYQHQSASTIAHLAQGQEVTCQFTWSSGYPLYVGSSDSSAPYVTAFSGYILW